MSSIPTQWYLSPPRHGGRAVPAAPPAGTGAGGEFPSILDAACGIDPETVKSGAPMIGSSRVEVGVPPGSRPADPNAALAAYRTHAASAPQQSDWEKYKDDQLLSNPGGDEYGPDASRAGGSTWWGRVGKDLKDAWSNVKNCFENALFGAVRRYRGANGEIRETRQKGLAGSLGRFVTNVGSALSFGTWRPHGGEAPSGVKDRIGYFLSTMKQAVCGDLLDGAVGSALQMGEDLALAAWNLAEAVPDATVGAFPAAERATTAVFDNGQVVIDYLTDIVPSGEAWQRVHGWDFTQEDDIRLPVMHNLTLPERYSGQDGRWNYVRNTPFRKTIETVGALIGDVLTLKVLGESRFLGEDRSSKK